MWIQTEDEHENEKQRKFIGARVCAYTQKLHKNRLDMSHIRTRVH